MITEGSHRRVLKRLLILGIMLSFLLVASSDASTCVPQREQVREQVKEKSAQICEYGPQIVIATCLAGGFFSPACIATMAIYAAGRIVDEHDPPDSNFTVIAEPVIPSFTPITEDRAGNAETADAMNAMLKKGGQVFGYGEVLVTCTERAQGAAAAGDVFWEKKQLEAAYQFAIQLMALYDALPTLFGNLQSSLQNAGFQSIPITAEDISDCQAEVTINGLPADLQDLLIDAGIDSETIEAIQSMLLAADPNEAAGSFPEDLTLWMATALQQDFFYNGTKKIWIKISDESIAIRFKEGVSNQEISDFLTSITGLSRNLADIVELEEAQIHIIPFVSPLSRDNRREQLEIIQSNEIVELAGQVVYVLGSTSPLILTNEFIAKFKPGVTETQIANLNCVNGVQIVRPDRFVNNQFLLRVAQASLKNAIEAANSYQESCLVEFAHPNFIVPVVERHFPNDPLFLNKKQWNLHNTGQGGGKVDADVDAPEAWDITTGDNSVVIAVIDSGVQITHPDLFPNRFINPGEIPENNIDDDNNGFVDDITGWNFRNGTPNTDRGYLGMHGTSVAGIAAAKGDNGVGVSGICPHCTILPIAAAGSGSTCQDHADGLNYAAAMGADIITNSWGYKIGIPIPKVVEDAINNVASTGRGGLGSVILFAMTNGKHDNCRCDNPDISSLASVIAVSRSTNLDLFDEAGFGNCMDVLAPTRSDTGRGTLGITTTDQVGDEGYDYSDDYYDNFSGTSAATSLVAGIAGLMLSVNPDLTRDHVQTILEQTADKIDAENAHYDSTGFSNTHGYGRVNAFKAVFGAMKEAFLITANENRTVEVRFSNLDGTFEPPVLIGDDVGSNYGEFAIADFTGDGQLDFIASTNENPADLYLFTRTGPTSFEQTFLFELDEDPKAAPDYGYGLIAADLNNDGHMDFLENINHDFGGNKYWIAKGNAHLNDGSANFTRVADAFDFSGWHNIYTGWTLGISSTVVDVNGDDYPDMLASGQSSGAAVSSKVYLLKGNGDGTFQQPVHVFTTAHHPATHMTLGDFNNDGKVDAIVGQDDDGDPGAAFLFLGCGDGTFEQTGVEAFDTREDIEWGSDRPGHGRFQAYDADHDGILDIISAAGLCGPVASQPLDAKLLVFHGRGNGTFDDPQVIAPNILTATAFQVPLTSILLSNVNNELTGTPDQSTFSFDPIPVPEGPAGTFSFSADFCNIGNNTFSGLKSVTVRLSGNNALLNRDSGTLPGVGSELTFHRTGGLVDSKLEPGECVRVDYEIGLEKRVPFQFFTDVFGFKQ